MNNRQRMYFSNQKARAYLLNTVKCTDVWFKRHTRRKDKTFTPNGYYPSTDLFNLFDGIALSPQKGIIYFQVKTNAWPKTEPLLDFARKYKAVVISINIYKRDGVWLCRVRSYE